MTSHPVALLQLRKILQNWQVIGLKHAQTNNFTNLMTVVMNKRLGIKDGLKIG